MRNTWYGDQRDLVKWASLIHLAKRESIQTIIQVAFLRKDSPPIIQNDSSMEPIADEVWSHFRSVESVSRLGFSVGLEIQVVTEAFNPEYRQDYVSQVAHDLRRTPVNKVVLLDPDTGLAPRTAKAEHVKEQEVSEIWDTLTSGDWLVLYQHRDRTTDWCERKRKQFQRVCDDYVAEIFKSSEVANDVAFFAIEKRSAG